MSSTPTPASRKSLADMGGATYETRLAADMASVVGLPGELIAATDRSAVRLHDGQTPGGIPLVRQGIFDAAVGIPVSTLFVTGDGTEADMLRLEAAMAVSASTKQPLVFDALVYRWRRQIRVPNGAGFTCANQAEFRFYASDTFTSKTRALDPAAANSHLVFAENCDDLLWQNIKIVFYAEQGSQVHGLCIRGGKRARIINFEGTGFCSGYVIKLDSTIDYLVSNPYIHDCTLNVNGGGRGGGQLSGIYLDDDKLESLAGIRILSTGTIINPRIARLKDSALTLSSDVGHQTDGISFAGDADQPLGGGCLILGGLIEECDEGIDHVSGCNAIVIGTKFKNITLSPLKYVHGSQNNHASAITIDGCGMCAVIISSSVGAAYTQNNTIDGLTVSRAGLIGAPLPPYAYTQSVIKFEDKGDGSNTGNARNNKIRGVRVYNCASRIIGVFVDKNGPNGFGNEISDFAYDDTLGAVMEYSDSAANLTANGRLELTCLKPPVALMGNADLMANIWDRIVRTTVPLTAPRLVSLPLAARVPANTVVKFEDNIGAVSATNVVTFRAVGSDILANAPNPSDRAVAIAYGRIEWVSDGVATWTRILRTAGLLALDNNLSDVPNKADARTNLGLGTTSSPTFTALTLSGSGTFQGGLTTQGTGVLRSGATIGGLADSTRLTRFDSLGRMTTRCDDNGTVNGLTVQNFGISAAGQGVDALLVELGTSGSKSGSTCFLRCQTLNTYASTAQASTKWVFGAASAGAIGNGLEVYATYAATPLLKLQGNFSVASLPAAGIRGRVADCSNCRVLTTNNGTLILQGSGAGTGGAVYDDGVAWRVMGTAIPAQA